MIDLPQDLLAVLRALRERGRPCLVGGSVRDALWGNRPKDFDIEVFGTTWERLLAVLQRFGPTDIVGRSFAVAKLRLQSGHHDFALPRRESKTGAGHRGFRVEPDPALDEREASSRRDFTINALLYDPFGDRVLDFHGGREDLERRVLRHTGPAFTEDPLRVLRGFQFAGRFGLSLAPETARLCASIADSYAELPLERVWGEWEKFASQAAIPSCGLRALRDSDWLRHFPELAALDGLPQEPEWHPEGDVFRHIGHCLDALVALPEWRDESPQRRHPLTFAVLAHDFGKAGTTVQAERDGVMRWISPGHDRAGGAKADAFLARIGSPLEMRPLVRSLVENHHAHQSWPPDGPSASAVRRLARKLRPATIGQLLVVMMADHLGRPPLISAGTAGRVARLRESAKALAVADAAPAPLLRGRDLLGAGMPPGPAMGEILEAAYDAQLDGAFSSTEEGLAWVRNRFPDTLTIRSE
ncbi:MAG: CCA tRNA nucleotidyltransferase [Opitutaceae bacterium]